MAAHTVQRAVRACLMRGGSSKGVFLRSEDLPPPGPLRDAVVLRIFGSPDARQIDGLGGADVLTSKLAIVGPPSVHGADVDYTFGQVSFVRSQVDYAGNCGNISAAVGPFAIDEGLVDAHSSVASDLRRLVRIHNTNTGALLRASVPVLPGAETVAEVEGSEAIAGVPGTGARIDLDFSATEGSVTGRLLPSGARKEVLMVDKGDGVRTEALEVTLLDAGQPTVFVDAAALGLDSLSSASSDLAPVTAAAELQAQPRLMQRIERLRGAGAVRMGIVERWQDAERLSPYAPFVVAVSAPAKDVPWDLSAVCVFMQRVHKAYPVTGSVATTAAALLPGTVAHAATATGAAQSAHSGDAIERALRIGHPSGVMEVLGSVRNDAQPALMRASVVRTARRLMDGRAYIPWVAWPSE